MKLINWATVLKSVTLKTLVFNFVLILTFTLLEYYPI